MATFSDFLATFDADPGKRGALLAARRSSGGSKRRAGHVMETLTFEIADAFSRASEMR
jgi:hypothetical protein